MHKRLPISFELMYTHELISCIPKLPDHKSAYYNHDYKGYALITKGFSIISLLYDIPVDNRESEQEDNETKNEKSPKRDIHQKNLPHVMVKPIGMLAHS